MNILNFEQEIEEKILTRGRGYFKEGRVEDLWPEDNTYFATVEGSERYEIEVALDEKGEILSSYCDCPYDWGEHCKHEVAVYYAIRESLGTPDKDHKKKKTPSLEQTVRLIPREELEALVVELAKRNQTLRQTILLTYSDSEEKSAHCKRLLEKAVLSYLENSYHHYDCSDCLPEIDIVLEQAEVEGDPVRALRLLFAAADTLLKHVGDDFDGCLVESVGLLLGAAYDLANKTAVSAKQKQANEFFQLLLNKALKPSLDGWSDWRMDLLQACALFCKRPELRSELEQALDRLAQSDSIKSTEEYSKRYELEHVLSLRLSLLEYAGETAQAKELLYSHLDLPDFRKRAIEEEIKKENYNSALRLCREGIEQDQEYAGLIHNWKKYMLEIYRQTGDLAGLREISRFLTLRGDLDAYREYKQSFSPAEWENQAKKEFLTSLQKQPGSWNTYPEVLKLEGECSLLLGYCEKFPRELLRYLPDLVETYPDETNQVYQSLILEDARLASDRKQYQKVCKLLLSYGKTFGRSKQDDLWEKLRASYPRRPAFQEELRTVR